MKSKVVGVAFCEALSCEGESIVCCYLRHSRLRRVGGRALGRIDVGVCYTRGKIYVMDLKKKKHYICVYPRVACTAFLKIGFVGES